MSKKSLKDISHNAVHRPTDRQITKHQDTQTRTIQVLSRVNTSTEATDHLFS